MKMMLAKAPPIVGVENLSADALTGWWKRVCDVLSERASGVSFAALIESLGRDWHAVGRVTFHLAENKRNEEFPFAFLATYTSGTNEKGQPIYVPLSRAIKDMAGTRDKQAMLKLLRPVVDATAQSAVARELLSTTKLYQPLLWTAKEAYAFLRDVPVMERAGVSIRVPDWWNAKRPPRPSVSVTVGESKRTPGANVGAEAMLDFNVGVALDGSTLTDREIEQLFTSTEPLVQLRGIWVEVDKAKLQSALEHWRKVEFLAREHGLDFATGMRLLTNMPGGTSAVEEKAQEKIDPEWVGIRAGEWLEKALDRLRSPDEITPPPALQATLRPYQLRGYAWLSFMTELGLGACLADDMGLGKTIQVIALLLKHAEINSGESKSTSLLVVPASLIPNWKSELSRFAPSLSVAIVHPSEKDSEVNINANVDVVITTYGMATRTESLRKRAWNILVIDEAQAIKNAGTKQTRAVKEINSRRRIAMSGTPVENRLGDLWSIFDFLNPGLLGSAKAFTKATKRMADLGNYTPLRTLVQPYVLRRLKTDKTVIQDLPDKIEQKAFCSLSPRQTQLYLRLVEELGSVLNSADTEIKRKGVVLAFLMKFKQLCNHPDQLLSTGTFDAIESGKFDRLRAIAEELASRQQRLLVFTQFREMTAPLERFLKEIFGRGGLILHGGVSVPQRKKLVDQFQQTDGPPFFVLSLKAGGVGLNLTAAAHVVHFDRWWNPAVENQATDRAFRIGQKQNVVVHKFICQGTIEEKIDAMISDKIKIADELFAAGGVEQSLTSMSNQQLVDFVKLDLSRALSQE